MKVKDKTFAQSRKLRTLLEKQSVKQLRVLKVDIKVNIHHKNSLAIVGLMVLSEMS